MVEVPIDISVVELDAGEYGALRTVVEELWPLVEESRVVFIPLHDEKVATSKLIVRSEVARNAANHVARVQARRFQDPGHERRGGRLAMRAGHHDRMALTQKKLRQGLR